MEQRTSINLLFSILLWLWMLYLNYKQIKHQGIKRGTSYPLYGLMMTLFCTFAFHTSDYYTYSKLYKECLTSYTTIHLEQFYFWLVKNLPPSYTIWRLAVWGSATAIWLATFKRLNIKAPLACLITTIVILYKFATPRQCLGYSMLLFSMTFVFKYYKNKYFSFTIALLGLFISFFLHRSMLLYLLLIPLAYIAHNKKFFNLSLIAFPFLYGSIIILSQDIIEFLYADTNESEVGMSYLEFQETQRTFFGWIEFIITRIPFLYIIGYYIWNIYYKAEYTDKICRFFLNYTYLLFYIGMLFFEQGETAVLSSRFLNAGFYPLTIFLAIYLSKKQITGTIMYLFYSFIIAYLYQFLYSIYKL